MVALRCCGDDGCSEESVKERDDEKGWQALIVREGMARQEEQTAIEGRNSSLALCWL
jgi:hypothetical protein